jgi:hypothetical protein
LRGNGARVKRILQEWPFVIVLSAVGFAFYPMLNAELGMIDDWGIVDNLGRGLTFANILEWIPSTLEHNGRFRPACMALWDLEIVAVGANASQFHFDRLLMAGISASALYLAARVFLSPVLSGVVTLMFFSGPQNEIWAHLQCCESYGNTVVLMGLAAIIVQVSRGIWRPTRLAPGLALLLFAGFLKESFIPLLPATLVFIYGILPWTPAKVFVGLSRPSVMDGVVMLLLVAGLVTQVVMTIQGLETYGHFRSADVSVTSFVVTVWWMITNYAKYTLWFVPVVVGLARLLLDSLQNRNDPNRVRELFKMLVLLSAGGLLILAPQAVVYAGTPQAGRYLTPGNIFVIFASILGLYYLSRAITTHAHAELRGGVIGMLAVLSLVGIFITHRGAEAEAASTRKFQERVTEIVQLKEQHPELPLLFYSARVWDREPLISVASYVKARLPNRERPFLNTFNWSTVANSRLEERMADRMLHQSKDGDEYFTRIADFRGTDGRCIAVIFTGFEDGHRCAYGIHVSID